MNLNEEQKRIITYYENMLVLASAGTGKTFCITQKVQYLKEKYHAKDEDFLIISFTNESVNDLKKKIKLDNIYTFHKLAMNILENNYSLCSDKLLTFIVDEYFNTYVTQQEKRKLLFYYLDYSYKRFLNSHNYQDLTKIIISFIKIMKANNYDYEYLKKLFYTTKDTFLITLIIKIYKIYEIEKHSQLKMDLDDLIIKASKIKKHFNYKYIFIDEFQDTSLIRFNLIFNIYQNANAKIYLFGDDYQSIYHFSGCNLQIMLDIKKAIPNIKTITLKQTYRNSQELIDIASIFINKNPKQIPKAMYSLKHLKKPIKIIYYTNPFIAFNKLVRTLDMTNVLILGRNNGDLRRYTNNEYKYLTVHKAKGLEAENVILINLNDDIYGFPNKIKNYYLIDRISPLNEIKYAEERRLFYVALTRSKNYVYILVKKNNSSIFIKELSKIMHKALQD